MSVPICPDCGYFDAETHICKKRPSRYYSDEEWKYILITRKRVAERQYSEYLEEKKLADEEKKLAEEERIRNAEIKQEINELKSCIDTLTEFDMELEKMANNVQEKWGSSIKEEFEIRNNYKIQIQKQFDNLDYDIEDIEETMVNSRDSVLLYPSKKSLMTKVCNIYDSFRKSHDRILDIIESFSSKVTPYIQPNCTCETYPSIYCRAHPSRDFRKDFTGADSASYHFG
jgi:flagellar biosynthesis GTPase FlhF